MKTLSSSRFAACWAVLLLLAVASPSLSQNPAGPVADNRLPMYGGYPKTEAMKAADRAFFRAIEERGESRERAAIRLSGAAMEFFFKKDFDTAMKRFNQAWMLDPRNSIPYFGFAKILELRDRNPAGASVMYRKSIEQADAPAFVFTEYLDLLVHRGLFEIGVAAGKAAILRHPGNADIHGYYAFSAYKTGDRAVACRQAARALEIGDAKNVALARSLAALSNSAACAR